MVLFSRSPVAAGSFYPNDPVKLRKTINGFFKKKPYKVREGYLNGLIAPHAGYAYSGEIAAKAYYELSKHEPRSFVILGPNHTGMGEELSVMYNSQYLTPLGAVRNDLELGRRVCKALNVDPDFIAHAREHSIEVQLPFLQFVYGKEIKVLPILIGSVDLATLKRVGSVLAKEACTIIASSDFTHHGSAYDYTIFNDAKLEVREHDLKAIELIQKLEVDEFHKLGEKSTICGFKPITVLLQAMKERGAKARFLGYATSADVTKDYDNMVGYASVVFN